MKKAENLLDLLKSAEEKNNEIVGIEFVDEEDTDSFEKPYNPNEIRIDHKFFSVFQICRWINAKPQKITIQPGFQRNLVWSERKKSLLIESLMLRIPIPSFYFYEDEYEHKSVIDGLQRLSTISEFVNDGFPLNGLQYLGDKCDGKRFSELDKKYISRIEDTQLSINILDSRTPELVKFDVFTRINTGGVPLNPQEIRHALASQQARNLLNDMSNSKAFINATHGAIKDIRMDAQELCLRFITFYNAFNKNTGTPKKDKPIAKMLDECIMHLNSSCSQTHNRYFTIFEKAMKKSSAAFGKRAFMKPKYKVINKPLFTSWAVTLAFSDCTEEFLLANQEKIINKLSEKAKEGTEYHNSITTSTATKKSIDTQFNTARKILEELMNVN